MKIAEIILTQTSLSM